MTTVLPSVSDVGLYLENSCVDFNIRNLLRFYFNLVINTYSSAYFTGLNSPICGIHSTTSLKSTQRVQRKRVQLLIIHKCNIFM